MRLITLAIHTYDRALEVRNLLEAEGIAVTLQNVNLEQPEVSSGVRVRIPMSDLPLALRIVENPEVFSGTTSHHIVGKTRRAVLVPVDYSEHSMNGAYAAIRFSAAHQADIIFIHAYMDPRLAGSVELSDALTFDVVDSEISANVAAEAEKKMAEFSKEIRSLMKNGALPMVKFTTIVAEGVPEEVIVQYAKANPPYLTVMGTRTASHKERDLIGSVTAEVLDESRFSVLTVPSSVDSRLKHLPGNVLFFSNLDQEDIIAMDTLYRYFPSAQSHVTIVHMPVRNRFVDRSAGRTALALSEYCCKTFNHYSFESVPISPKTALDELDNLHSQKHFDLIVVPSRRKNAFLRLFNPGLAHKILFQTDIPMLVIPV